MNFQNIPRSDKVIKKAFVPKLDCLISMDYKNIEPRLLGWYLAMLGDESIADVFRRGEDIYVTLARSALGIYDRPLTDAERQVGKVLNLAITYGGGCPTIMRNLGVPYERARELLDGFHREWPGVKMLAARLEERIQERGYITTIGGRHLWPDSNHKLVNALLQGSAAELMKAATVRVHQWMREQELESHIVSVIHDDLLQDCRLSEVPLIVETVPRLMVDPRITELVPVPVDVDISFTSWADMQPYDTERSLVA